MQRIKSFFLTSFLFLIVPGQSLFGAENEIVYYRALANNYEVPYDSIKVLAQDDIPGEEMAVALHISSKAEISLRDIIKLRLNKKSWADIVKSHSIGPSAFFMMLGDKIDSKTYAPIMAKFGKIPEEKWDQLELTDGDYVNLANLKFIAVNYGYSVFEIMAMRDAGRDFVDICREVKILKEEISKKEKQAQEEAIKVRENKGE
jgi:hypothetical protein